jgi:hypothetical protein
MRRPADSPCGPSRLSIDITDISVIRDRDGGGIREKITCKVDESAVVLGGN